MYMEQLVDFFLNFYGPLPYFYAFIILLSCGLGLPIPEDITLFACAIISYYGLTNVWIMTAICFLAIILGDLIIFYLGGKYGRKLTKVWFFKTFLSEERLAGVKTKFH